MFNSKQKVIVLSATLIGSMAAYAEPTADSGFLIGIDAGQAEAKKYCDNISNCDNADTSVRANIGYQFNQFWTAELGYTSFGTLFDSDDSSFDASQKASALTASAIGSYPLGERFAIFGRAGAARYDTNNRGTVQGVPVKNEDDIKPYFGAGLKFNVTPNFALRAEYQLYTDISRVDGDKDNVQGLYAGTVFKF